MLKPSFFAQLPDEFKDFLTKHLGDKSLSEVLCIHSHHELFYKKWKLLIDEEFINADHHDIVISCCDGARYWFCPQIFMYSTNYPKK